jgi:hypothetical protein
VRKIHGPAAEPVDFRSGRPCSSESCRRSWPR